jgi:hypothetical protein
MREGWARFIPPPLPLKGVPGPGRASTWLCEPTSFSRAQCIGLWKASEAKRSVLGPLRGCISAREQSWSCTAQDREKSSNLAGYGLCVVLVEH